MTKNQEIQALQSFIQSLPADSYLHPWLTDILPDIQREIACDYIPAISPATIRTEFAKHRAEMLQQREAIHAEIERCREEMAEERKRIITEAQKRAEEIERNAKTKLAADIARLQSALAALQ